MWINTKYRGDPCECLAHMEKRQLGPPRPNEQLVITRIPYQSDMWKKLFYLEIKLDFSQTIRPLA